MAEFLAGIEHLALARWLKASFIAYPIVNALHIMSIGALLTSVVLMDLRICGAFRSLPQAAFVALLRRIALSAFAGALVTGSLLFSVKAGTYAAMPVFLAKMALILLAGVNFLAFMRLRRATGGDELAGSTILAVLSILLWTSVLFAGRFIGFL
ncbi:MULTISPECIES: DUF6644 family protein [unclassified Mesorhizobium]|uniref:DUF6644 family protein n=1 Tax=unclassified Mesorhizobium TaxID=325217 RepID=UPI000FC9D018|nr:MULTISPECIES: DUF6644 family protein [unclassified Mesorhizobium]RUZ90732.1 hypothetical protein EN947_05645 [Mesorhizobium sp. M7A.F.Ca.US.003.02.2.1]RUY95074.1 hypothetical protein EN974_22385 [Mesorhizobium sp. M7A.F.Ca.CA.001.12.2.1]RUZ29216.1 hypothetical protein EN949_04550 [Mesorhizobium sp. M7A.F.Ca.US.007.01.2.1]RUZ46384.1 hypothetical protein EN948_15835 [Mesorhizobium sp. M7A.F.Ca.US.003.02.1.1]RUZ59632.1 hypothetical protein EN950_21265 [Mesorhizobium sp. M7A.F.Ca.US.007.01.1.1]